MCIEDAELSSESSSGLHGIGTLCALADRFNLYSVKTHRFTRTHRNPKPKERPMPYLEVGLKPIH